MRPIAKLKKKLEALKLTEGNETRLIDNLGSVDFDKNEGVLARAARERAESLGDSVIAHAVNSSRDVVAADSAGMYRNEYEEMGTGQRDGYQKDNEFWEIQDAS